VSTLSEQRIFCFRAKGSIIQSQRDSVGDKVRFPYIIWTGAKVSISAIDEWRINDFLISTDNEKLDIQAVHHYLTRSTWAKGIDLGTVTASTANSLNFGLYHHESQIGFARLITDYATFAYLCDVYVLEEYQGEGLGRWLMECIHSHPIFEKLRKILLFTTTAPWLYEKFGYEPVNQKNYAWAITRPDIYSDR